SNRTGSPLLSIFSRWGMWILFRLSGAYISQTLIGSERPFLALAGMYFLGWVLLETLFQWMAISAWSRAMLPLFPRYRKNEDGDEWPNQKQFIQLRDELRRTGFTKVSALKAEIQG